VTILYNPNQNKLETTIQLNQILKVQNENKFNKKRLKKITRANLE
jgi:hypothetical protein